MLVIVEDKPVREHSAVHVITPERDGLPPKKLAWGAEWYFHQATEMPSGRPVYSRPHPSYFLSTQPLIDPP